MRLAWKSMLKLWNGKNMEQTLGPTKVCWNIFSADVWALILMSKRHRAIMVEIPKNCRKI